MSKIKQTADNYSSSQITSSQITSCNKTGKIKSVYCKHFVTYEECTFYPTEYLNVIIGPNGTGKSTLVAAIVLGLGGEPKLLSRASSIQDYIKNGRTMAKIEVEIHANDHGKTVVFQRTFDDSNKSEFRMNNEILSKNKFLTAVAVYKIQISNLCQFLPQDRVQDFAKMNPQEILLNTINSVCSPEVIENFTKLKDLRKKQQNGKKTLTNDMQKLKESMTRVEELKQILERYNARKEFLEKLNVCNAKKMWLEVDEIKVKTAEFTVDLITAKKNFEERKKVYDEILKKQSVITRTTTRLRDDADEKERSVAKVLENKNIVSKKIDVLKIHIREAKSNFEKMKRDLSDRQSDIRNETKMLEVIMQDLKNAKDAIGPDIERVEELKECEQKIENLKLDICKQLTKRSDINKKLDEEYAAEVQMLKKRIERSQNVNEQKLQLLRNNFPDLYSAVLWLRDNRNLFAETVYNPMILELNVRDSNHAKYLENSIPLKDLLAFTCENKSDVSLLINELRIKQKLSVNVIHSPAADECKFKSTEPIVQLKKFGFISYLIDLIEGPPAILNYLCSLHNLHRIPIGTEHVNKCTDSIPTNIRKYFGGDVCYNVSISKYSREPSLMQNRIQGKQLLSSKDVNEIEMLTKKLNELLKKTDILKNERSSIEAKIRAIECQRTEVIKTKQTINSKSLRYEQLRDKFKRQQQKVSQIKMNIISVPEMEKEFTHKVQQCLEEIMNLQKQKADVLGEYEKATAEKKLSLNRTNIYLQENEALTNAMNEAHDNKKESQRFVDTITNALETSKRKSKVKMAEAQGLTNNCKPNDPNFPHKDLYDELPNNIEAIKESINEYSARLDCMTDVDQEIVSEYELKCTDVDKLKKIIEENLDSEENMGADIQSIYKDWYPVICGMVDTLNKHFGDFMESMNYVGDVLLAKQSEFDFDTYGIQIMVQYRKNVPLQALDRHVQSGGERAVAIAVYTLSLQHITHVPFRCVDEINQGMDARNERKIFEMLVEETTQTGRAQYFFVTPKLLSNLMYNERMSVHVVFNGKMIQPINAFTFSI